MAGLFKAKKPESDGIEFWHNPERSGWLMKQGGCATQPRRQYACSTFVKQGQLTCVLLPFLQESTSRRGAAGVCQHGVVPHGQSKSQRSCVYITRPLMYPLLMCDHNPRRWFVLKQGKIYWFKSDVVTPVSAQPAQPTQP